MRFINTKLHGILDYLAGILLLLTPWLWEYDSAGMESLVPLLVGVTVIAVSLMTDYEAGVLRIIPMKTHLLFDIFSGLFLGASPWLFGFEHNIYLPHVLFGGLEISAGLFTKLIPTGNKNSNLI